jgi:hypothetical protein
MIYYAVGSESIVAAIVDILGCGLYRRAVVVMVGDKLFYILPPNTTTKPE